MDIDICHFGHDRVDDHLAPLVDTAAGHTFTGIDMGMAHLQGHDLRCLG